MQSELLLEKQLVEEEGFKDKKYGAPTAVVQKSVYRLSKAGSLLAAKDLAALADVLGCAPGPCLPSHCDQKPEPVRIGARRELPAQRDVPRASSGGAYLSTPASLVGG